MLKKKNSKSQNYNLNVLAYFKVFKKLEKVFITVFITKFHFQASFTGSRCLVVFFTSKMKSEVLKQFL